jgi:formylmethanofuran dehydrogenase subunit B
MSAFESTSSAAGASWTCPFCPLLCDTFSIRADAAGLTLVGSECTRARAALTRFPAVPINVGASIDGRPVDADAAIAAAARVLAASRQPLFGGLGTDVAGARALYPLACMTGAISDPASGAAMLHGLRATQDRGGFTATLAEVRTRADLIVCLGGLPTERLPEFLRRCGVGDGREVQVVVLQPASAPVVPTADAIEFVTYDGDLFDAVAMLGACTDERAPAAQGGPLVALAARLRGAHYAVLAYEAARLPAHGSILIEAINRIVATLNRKTRAAALPLGGVDGATTVNQVFTWLSGLPLRSRAGAAGLEHEPLRFDAQRLIDDHAVDALLWIASFGTEPPVAAAGMPRIVLGHPHFAPALQSADTIFIPVSTPGIGSSGHLFRTDGVVLLPLHAVVDDGLPTVADVLTRLQRALQQPPTGAST